MKVVMKKIVCLSLALALVLSCATGVFAATEGVDTQAAAKSATSWLKRKNLDPKGDEAWVVIALCRGGYTDIFSARMEGYQNNLQTYISGTDYFPESPDADAPYELYAPNVMAATAVGKVATLMSFGDLVMGLSWSPNLDAAGADGWCYGLIAADCGNYKFTEGGNMTRDIAVEKILSWQRADGAFTWEGSPALRTTSLALTALANYSDRDDVAAAIAAGKAYLLSCQQADGSFGVNGQTGVEDTALAVVAFCTLGDDPSALAGGDAMAALVGLQRTDGGFPAQPGGEKADQDTTCQGLLALAAYNRLTAGQDPVFNMADVYGASHNKLSPAKTKGVKWSFITLFLITTSIIIVGFRGQLRQNKWRKEGKLNEKTSQRYSDDEVQSRVDMAEAQAYMSDAHRRLSALQSRNAGDLTPEKQAELDAAQAALAAARAAGREAPAPLPIPAEVAEELARKAALAAEAAEKAAAPSSNLAGAGPVDVSTLPEVTSAPVSGKAARRKADEKARSAEEYASLSDARSELEAARARREAARRAAEAEKNKPE